LQIAIPVCDWPPRPAAGGGLLPSWIVVPVPTEGRFDAKRAREMRAGIREVVSHSDGRGRIASASRTTLMVVLCAGAFAPVAVAAAGGVGVAAASLTIAGALGGNVLSGVIMRAVDRLRGRSVNDLTIVNAADELVMQLEQALASDDANAQALRVEIAGVLHEVGAVRETIDVAMQSGDEAFQSQVRAALTDLAGNFAEFEFMFAEVKEAVRGLQREVLRQGVELLHQVHLNREQNAQIQMTLGGIAKIHGHTEFCRGDTTLASVWQPGTAPYRGLWPFRMEEATLFYGRERITAALTARLAESLSTAGMIIVTGASGAGKSSLIQAGLLSAIKREGLPVLGSERWPQLVITPTAAPLDELASRVASLGDGLGAISVRSELTKNPQEAHLLVRQALLSRRDPASTSRSALFWLWTSSRSCSRSPKIGPTSERRSSRP
jgi:hypothetical protein